VPVQSFEQAGDGVFVAMFNRNKQVILIRLIQVPPHSLLPGGIISITLHSVAGGEISLRLMDRGNCVLQRSSLTGMAPQEIVLSTHQQSEAELVSQELDLLYADPLFESSLATLAGALARSRK
jgi:hypothetical protein